LRLPQAGWKTGQNTKINYRWAAGDVSRLGGHAAELIADKPDVLFVVGTPALVAARKQTSSVPIVFVQVADPVGAGAVSTFSHPGGNVTGFTNYESSMGGKWLELLREVAPAAPWVLVLFNPGNPSTTGLLQSIQSAADAFGVRVRAAPVEDRGAIQRTFDGFDLGVTGGVVVLNDLITSTHRDLIIEHTAQHRLPAVYPFRHFVTDGGLMSYGMDMIDADRRAAAYVDRILRGERPGELPVQAPVKFEMAINVKTARSLGLVFPQSILLRADEVIE